METKFSGHRFCVRVALFCTAIASTLFILACASDPQTTDTDPEYSTNMFYLGSAETPSRPRRAHVDFFDKVCTGSSSSGNSSGTYQCHYTDE